MENENNITLEISTIKDIVMWIIQFEVERIKLEMAISNYSEIRYKLEESYIKMKEAFEVWEKLNLNIRNKSKKLLKEWILATNNNNSSIIRQYSSIVHVVSCLKENLEKIKNIPIKKGWDEVIINNVLIAVKDLKIFDQYKKEFNKIISNGLGGTMQMLEDNSKIIEREEVRARYMWDMDLKAKKLEEIEVV